MHSFTTLGIYLVITTIISVYNQTVTLTKLSHQSMEE